MSPLDISEVESEDTFVFFTWLLHHSLHHSLIYYVCSDAVISIRKANSMKLRCKTELVEFKESTSELKEGVRSLVSRLNKHKKGPFILASKTKVMSAVSKSEIIR